jgi:hypothetical protein
LFARVDDVGIDFVFCRVRAHTEYPVLALEPHFDAVGHEGRGFGGYADAEVDVETWLELFGCAACDAVAALGGFVGGRRWARRGGVAELLDLDVLGGGGGHDAVDENAGEVYGIGVECANGDDFFGFDDSEAGGFGHDGPEGFGGVSVASLATE